MLIDSGATTSFICPSSLDHKTRKMISEVLDNRNQGKNSDFKRIKLSIKAALESKTVDCVVGKVKISVKDWIRELEFIFTEMAEPAILV